MRIKVTDVETGSTDEYDYSKDNWAKRYACMRGGLVHMWAPKECRSGVVIVTSGRRWEVVK